MFVSERVCECMHYVAMRFSVFSCVVGMRGVGSLCLFVFVSSRRLLQSAPLAVMACL